MDAEKDATFTTAVLCALARGHVLLHDGDEAGAIRAVDEAERLTRESRKFVNVRTEALVEIATLCSGVGQHQRAIETLDEAIELARAKGNVDILRRAERELAGYRRAQERA
jgi:tetratricopeptide (TPR) repeat protein